MTAARITIKKPADPLSAEIKRRREIIRRRYEHRESEETAPASNVVANKSYLAQIAGITEGLV